MHRARGHRSSSSRWLPAVGESGGWGLRRCSGLGPQRGRRGTFYSNYKARVGGGQGRLSARRESTPAPHRPDSARVWLELGAEGVSN